MAHRATTMNEPRRRIPKARELTEKRTSAETETQHHARNRKLPPYKVILHNDTINEMSYVVMTIMELTRMGRQEATQRMLEAHQRGVALLLITHKERAELFTEQFASCNLTVTIQPA